MLRDPNARGSDVDKKIIVKLAPHACQAEVLMGTIMRYIGTKRKEDHTPNNKARRHLQQAPQGTCTSAKQPQLGKTRLKQRQDGGVTEAAFQDVLQRLRRDSAPRLNGWIYEHLRAPTSTSPTATTAAPELTNLLLNGCPLPLSSLHAFALIALEIPEGQGVWPIAIGEVWIGHPSLYATAACPNAGPSLAPFCSVLVSLGG
jgi:hypothetical protein